MKPPEKFLHLLESLKAPRWATVRSAQNRKKPRKEKQSEFDVKASNATDE